MTIPAIAAIVALGLGLGALSGCISAPPPKPNAIGQARHENVLGNDLAQQFESKLSYRTDPAVDRYLTEVAGMVARASGDVRLTSMKVVVISSAGRQWRSFSLPGRKIYLPIGLLRLLHFDNEVAAAIALEDGNILEKHAIDHLTRQLAKRAPKTKKTFLFISVAASDSTPKEPARVTSPVDFFGPDGIFTFDTDEMKASISSAVRLMYEAGFDVRGLLELWDRYGENPAHSPFTPKQLEEFSQFTRETISLYAPLRDPIVGTRGFKPIRERIENL